MRSVGAIASGFYVVSVLVGLLLIDMVMDVSFSVRNVMGVVTVILRMCIGTWVGLMTSSMDVIVMVSALGYEGVVRVSSISFIERIIPLLMWMLCYGLAYVVLLSEARRFLVTGAVLWAGCSGVRGGLVVEVVEGEV